MNSTMSTPIFKRNFLPFAVVPAFRPQSVPIPPAAGTSATAAVTDPDSDPDEILSDDFGGQCCRTFPTNHVAVQRWQRGAEERRQKRREARAAAAAAAAAAAPPKGEPEKSVRKQSGGGGARCGGGGVGSFSGGAGGDAPAPAPSTSGKR